MALLQYSKQDVYEALKRAEVFPGATIMMHSSLYHLGCLEGRLPREQPKAVADCLLEYLGDSGTLCVPAAFWDYGKKNIPFDIKRSPVVKDLGVLSSHVAFRAESMRSPNPIFSVAAVGKSAHTVCESRSGNDFGSGSAWDALFHLNAEIVFFGASFNTLTFARYMEHRFGVPYLYTKWFNTPVLDDGVPLNLNITATLRYREYPAIYDLSKLEKRLKSSGCLRCSSLGGGEVMAVNMKDCFDVGMEALREDVHGFLAAIPAYQSDRIPLA